MVRYRGAKFMNFLSKNLLKWYELIRETQNVQGLSLLDLNDNYQLPFPSL